MQELRNNKIEELEREEESLREEILKKQEEISRLDDEKKGKQESLYETLREKKEQEEKRFTLLDKEKKLEKKLENVFKKEEREVLQGGIKELFGQIIEIGKKIEAVNEKINIFRKDNLLPIEEKKAKLLESLNKDKQRIEEIGKEIVEENQRIEEQKRQGERQESEKEREGLEEEKRREEGVKVEEIREHKEIQEDRKEEEKRKLEKEEVEEQGKREEEKQRFLEKQNERDKKEVEEVEKQKEIWEKEEKERAEIEETRKQKSEEQEKQENQRKEAEQKEDEEQKKNEEEKQRIDEQKRREEERQKAEEQKRYEEEGKKIEEHKKQEVVQQTDKKKEESFKRVSSAEIGKQQQASVAQKEDTKEEKIEKVEDLLQRAISLYKGRNFDESISFFQKALEQSQEIEKKPTMIGRLLGKKTISSQAKGYILKVQRELKRKEKMEQKIEKEQGIDNQKKQRGEEKKRTKNQKKQEVIQRAEEKKKRQEEKREQKIKEKQLRREKKKEGISRKDQDIKTEESKQKEEKDEVKAKKAKIQPIKRKKSRFLSRLLDITRRPFVGIDISDHSIEVMQLNMQGKIAAYGRSILEEGIVNDGEILKQKELIGVLRETLKNTKPFPLIKEEEDNDLRAVISLPESKAYVLQFDFESKENIYDKIKQEIKNTIPLQMKDIYWDFIKTKNENGKAKVLCVAINQDIIDNYIYFLRASGVTPVVFDVESSSAARSLLPKTYNFPEKEKEDKEMSEDVLILDIGARTTIITAYDVMGVMHFAVSVSCAGSLFTEKIAEFLNVPREEAERLKIEKGFLSDSGFFPALEEAVGKIISEMEEAIVFYRRNLGKDIEKVILVGGSALLPGIVDYFQKLTKAKVEIGDPLSKIGKTDILDRKRGVLYTNVVGLALRGISENPVKNGINLLPTEIKTKEMKIQQGKRKSVLIASIVIAFFGLLLLAFTILYFIYLPASSTI